MTKYSFDSLRKEGLVPWEVNRVYGRLVNAFKQEMRDSVLFYAADLGHYVSDAHVPLHTTKNHDGQLTNQKGMHVLWESLVPEAQLKNYALYQPQAASYIAKPQDFIFQVLLESHAMLPEMFKVETEVRQALGEEKSFKMVERYGKMQRYYTDEFIQAYAAKLGSSIQGRMIQSSQRVASFWYSAWKDAGSPTWVTNEINAEKKAAFALTEGKLVDGTIVAYDLESGEIFVVGAEGESIPAPVGEHQLESGEIVVVLEEGKRLFFVFFLVGHIDVFYRYRDG